MPSLFLRFLLFLACVSGVATLMGCSHHSTKMSIPTATHSLAAYPAQHSPVPQRIALLLPLRERGSLAGISQAIKQGFVAAAEEHGAQAKIIVLDTARMPSIQAAYNQAVAQKAQFVVGPLLKPQVQTLAGLSLSTPVLALNYLSTNISIAPQLYQFGLSPLDEIRETTRHARQHGHRNALIMTPQGDWGTQMAQAFSEQWERLGGRVTDHLTLERRASALTKQIGRFLQFKPPHDRRTDFDVIFIASNPRMGRQLKPLLSFFYAGEVPVYATASVYSGLPHARRLDRDLSGVIFCSAPWTIGVNTTNTSLYHALQTRYPKSFRRDRRYYALGVDAFHIVEQLPRLQRSPSQVLMGATGQLTLNGQRRIVRALVCAKFRGGVPHRL